MLYTDRDLAKALSGSLRIASVAADSRTATEILMCVYMREVARAPCRMTYRSAVWFVVQHIV